MSLSPIRSTGSSSSSNPDEITPVRRQAGSSAPAAGAFIGRAPAPLAGGSVRVRTGPPPSPSAASGSTPAPQSDQAAAIARQRRFEAYAGFEGYLGFEAIREIFVEGGLFAQSLQANDTDMAAAIAFASQQIGRTDSARSHRNDIFREVGLSGRSEVFEALWNEVPADAGDVARREMLRSTLEGAARAAHADGDRGERGADLARTIASVSMTPGLGPIDPHGASGDQLVAANRPDAVLALVAAGEGNRDKRRSWILALSQAGQLDIDRLRRLRDAAVDPTLYAHGRVTGRTSPLADAVQADRADVAAHLLLHVDTGGDDLAHAAVIAGRGGHLNVAQVLQTQFPTPRTRSVVRDAIDSVLMTGKPITTPALSAEQVADLQRLYREGERPTASQHLHAARRGEVRVVEAQLAAADGIDRPHLNRKKAKQWANALLQTPGLPADKAAGLRSSIQRIEAHQNSQEPRPRYHRLAQAGRRLIGLPPATGVRATDRRPVAAAAEAIWAVAPGGPIAFTDSNQPPSPTAT